WQLNNKIQMSDLPSWDGNGKTLIDYLIRMYELASRSELLARGLGIWAPDYLKGTARSWWLTIPQSERSFLNGSWWRVDECIRAHFIDKSWLAERTLEFDSIRFRSSEHKSESPLAFIQRRNHYATFLYPYSKPEDEPLFVTRLLSTAPPSWEPHINERNCPTVVQLQAQAKQLSLTLVTVWKTEERFKEMERLDPSTSFRRKNFNRKAYITEIEECPDVDEVLEDETTLAVSVAAADSRKEPYKGNTTSQGASNHSPPSRFERDDSVRSKVPPPNGKTCYVCRSPMHFARDCRNYGQWTTLKSLNKIHVNI
ncbi:hypothetical protein C8R42DRAFT_551652, partial [Lentinula raphanica]